MKRAMALLFFFLISVQFAQAQYTWQLKLAGGGRGNPILVDPNNDNIVYYGSTNTIHKSTDRGETFTQFGTTLPSSSNVKNLIAHPTKQGSFLVSCYRGGTSTYRIYKTTDNGQTWTTVRDNLTFSFYGIPMDQDPSHPDTVYMMDNANFYRTPDFGETWQLLTSNTGTVGAPCDIETFPDTSIILIGDNTKGILRSTDYGMTWTQVYTTSGEIPTIDVDFNRKGVAWATKFSGGNQVVRTTNYGATWDIIANFGTSTWGVSIHPTNPDYVAVGTWSGSNVFITKDFGSTWIQTTLPASNYAVHVIDTMNVFAGQSGGFYKLTSPYFVPVEFHSFTANAVNNVVTLDWQTATETNNYGFEIQRSINNNDFETIHFIQGAGTTTDKRSYSYSFDEKYFGTIEYRLKQIDYDGTTAYSNVVLVDITSPNSFELIQNFPNPFNPTTTIQFQISSAGSVNLRLYDVLGNKIADLISNENYQPGVHSFFFDSNRYNLSSGIYFYKLEVVEVNNINYSATKKLVLMK